MTERSRILTSPGFLLGLALLLANDWIFKPAFHNGLTGKLSDFAGLFIFPLFWTALFPRHKPLVFAATAVGFIFWKTPYSQPLLDAWNAWGFWPLARVVDLTDLIALGVLPLAYYYTPRARAGARSLAPTLSLVLAAFAFAATSYRSVETYNQTYPLQYSKPALRARMVQDSVLNYFGKQMTTRDRDTMRINIYAMVPGNADFFVKFEAVDSAHCTVTLLTATSRTSPRNKKNRQAMLDFFENQFIARLTKP